MTETRAGKERATAEPRNISARERILQACSELFSRDGIRAVGVDAIVERAGVAKATLYKHFPSKDDLVLAWLRGHQARWLDRLSSEVEGRAQNPLERLVVIFDVLGEWFQEPTFEGCDFANSAAEIRDPNHPVRIEIRSFIAEVEAWVGRQAEAAGLHEPDELAAQIKLLAAGAINLAFATSSPGPAATGRTAVLTLLASRLSTTPEGIERRIAQR
jgi:AcrR family transcriptional regulator